MLVYVFVCSLPGGCEATTLAQCPASAKPRTSSANFRFFPPSGFQHQLFSRPAGGHDHIPRFVAPLALEVRERPSSHLLAPPTRDLQHKATSTVSTYLSFLRQPAFPGRRAVCHQ
ncbi:hypothetical protein E2C01_042577 [Portunus trituberculatus]|uniref:Secreted protein n=1 Tax=Portunus trituberculatus TaxID=210409 RepID=A0A5B7FWW2_PORTR|nr:hypothetical protein [Portunus trituberculatus]